MTYHRLFLNEVPPEHSVGKVQLIVKHMCMKTKNKQTNKQFEFVTFLLGDKQKTNKKQKKNADDVGFLHEHEETA